MRVASAAATTGCSRIFARRGISSIRLPRRSLNSGLLAPETISYRLAALQGNLQNATRWNSTSTRTTSSSEPPKDSSTSPPPPPPPPQSPLLPRVRRYIQIFARVTLATIILSGGVFYYTTQRDRNPGPQLPHDPSKKTLVVLGSGWGATSLLKHLDTEDWNVVVVSPKNFFLFTPLLPSVAVGTLSSRSIIQSTRYITRHKKRIVKVIEGEAYDIDPISKAITISDHSPIVGSSSQSTLNYDYLVFAVGAETQTFGIPGVKEHACFMKELGDAEKFQDEIMDCIESAAFPGQPEEEIDRLLHMIVVGGGPTGIELSGEIHDFLEQDLRSWYPELAPRMRITLIEALPSVLPMFSKQLIDYTESTFKTAKIDIKTKTMVKEVKPTSVVIESGGVRSEIPMGLLVWAGGNTLRPLTKKLMSFFPTTQTNKRGLTIDDNLRLVVPSSSASLSPSSESTDALTKSADARPESIGSPSIFAIGDCTASTYAPTAQVASQQGAYLARTLVQIAKADTIAEKIVQLESTSLQSELRPSSTSTDGSASESKVATPTAEDIEAERQKLIKQLARLEHWKPFHYSHQGSLAYIGSDKAIADLPFPWFHGNVATAGVATFLFWRSAYLSTLFSLRNRVLVGTDWVKTKIFGR